MSYFSHIKQNVVADANNSSVTNLAVGNSYRFVGAPTSTLGVAGIQVSLWTNQNALVYVQQSPGSVTGVGTVAFNDGTTITGTSTEFLDNFSPGDTIVLDSAGTPLTRIVATVTSNTVLTVTVATTGGSLSGKAYTFYPWDTSELFTYTSKGTFGTTVQAVSSYCRVKVTTMSATTTQFRLQTALCPVVEAVPRSLDNNGNYKVTLQADRFSNPIENSTLGELQTVQRVRLAGAQFDGNTLDTNFWNTSVATGTITQSSSNVTITSGTAAGHRAALYSIRKARFVTGTSNKYRCHLRLADTGTANVKRRWGIGQISNYSFAVSGTPNVTAGDIYTNNSQEYKVGVSGTGVAAVSMIGTGAPAASGTLTQVVGSGGNLTFTAATAQAVVVDGAYFELDGTTFSVVTCKGGSETRVSSGSFNGQLGYTYAVTTNNTIFEIAYGNGSVTFIVGQVPLHKVTASTATWTNTIHLNIFADVNNSDASSAVAMYSRAMNITRIGQMETAPIWKRLTAATGQVIKYGAGRLHHLVFNTFNNGATATVYDAITATNTIAVTAPPNNIYPGTVFYNLDFYNGLTITLSGTLDVTVVYE